MRQCTFGRKRIRQVIKTTGKGQAFVERKALPTGSRITGSQQLQQSCEIGRQEVMQ